MTDHFARSVALLDEVEEHKKALRALYLDRIAPNRSHLIASKHDAIRQGLQGAKVHAQLAEVAALYDLRSEVAELFKVLTRPAVSVVTLP